jgi:RNA polymerase sigma factor (sigma-70 family)
MASDRDWAEIAKLVERSRAGDEESFRDLLQRHRSAVTSTLVACGVRCPDTAQDLAQEVALKMWSRLESLSDPRAFTAWLRRIAANTARDHLRRLAARRESELDAALDLVSADDPEQDSERRAELRIMLAALAQEDDEIVELLTARADGEPVAEIDAAVANGFSAFEMPKSRRSPVWFAAAAAIVVMIGATTLWRVLQPIPDADGVSTIEIVQRILEGTAAAGDDLNEDGAVDASDLVTSLVSSNK